jgi:hypothetical protein
MQSNEMLCTGASKLHKSMAGRSSARRTRSRRCGRADGDTSQQASSRLCQLDSHQSGI